MFTISLQPFSMILVYIFTFFVNFAKYNFLREKRDDKSREYTQTFWRTSGAEGN